MPRRMKDRLQQADSNMVWREMKTITGFKQKNQEVEGDRERANELNQFFNSLLPHHQQSSIALDPPPTRRPLGPLSSTHTERTSQVIRHSPPQEPACSLEQHRKLSVMQVDQDIVAWITDYLTDRPQFVRLQSSRSDVAVSNAGSPQGTVLSPFLFTLYTSDFRYNSETCHFQKFADDSSIVGCITEDSYEEYSGLVQSFVRWSEAKYLQRKTSKTKELVVDFRRNKKPLTPITIQGNEVEVVEVYKARVVELHSWSYWRYRLKRSYWRYRLKRNFFGVF
ncbi:hypothetical protein DPEC_G00152850 [Dallia pectoralis]|uniref:Uncharacterized protein n=2 Tax=Dallia pectoralis TaxID=75939 RepID=A0ACC2GJS1_DALPE|nr:hypothetical protein DPEC_G00152830 [Dallia pectoralis]KAJ8003866.1 hypothetical protein DPEC_G00152850 [Dallia pectoralis]